MDNSSDKEIKFYCVYKTDSQGAYGLDYVERLFDARNKYFPNCSFHCLSDDPNAIGYEPLEYNLDGWWSKMELFKPSITGNVFYIDLDTIVRKNIERELDVFLESGKSFMLADFYHPERLASGVMFLTENDRDLIWTDWLSHFKKIHDEGKITGDQDAIGHTAWVHGFERFQFQTNMKDFATSYKYLYDHLIPGHLRQKLSVDIKRAKERDNKIVCFHGKPRPRDVQWKI